MEGGINKNQHAAFSSAMRTGHFAEISSIGCITFSLDGHVLEVTPGVEKITGYSGTELAGLSLGSLVLENHRDAVLDQFAAAIKNAPSQSSVRFALAKADKSLVQSANFYFSPLLNRYKEVTAIAAFLYMPAVLESEENEQRSTEISKLIGQIGHDIRTPLMSIISATELLKDHPENTDVIIEFLDRSSKRLFETVESVLRLARLDNDFELQLDPNDLHEYVIETVDLFKHQAGKKDIDLSYVGPVNEKLPALIDGAAISRILVNLIDNALKYTEKGSIEVSLAHIGRMVRIEVRDTGLGISENFISDIFSDFSRQAASDLIKREGLGLGLSITKRLVGMMNGTIRVESTQGEGSTFTVEIPHIPV